MAHGTERAVVFSPVGNPVSSPGYGSAYDGYAFSGALVTATPDSIDGSTATIVVTLSSAAVKGNLLVSVWGTVTASLSSVPVDDLSGVVWRLAKADAAGDSLVMAYKIAEGGEATVTFDDGTGGGFNQAALVYELAGPWDPDPLDKTAVDTLAAQSAFALDPGTLSRAGGVVIGGYMTRTPATITMDAHTNNHIEILDIGAVASGTTIGIGTTHKLVNAPLTHSNTVTLSGSSTCSAVLAAFKSL